MLDLGKGSGPMNHAFDITGEYVRLRKIQLKDTGKYRDRNRYAFCRKGDSLTWKQNVLQYMKTA